MMKTAEEKHDEELLEQIYWEFDDAKKSGDERLKFKSKLRWYASHFAQPLLPKSVEYTHGDWFLANTIDEMQAFYMARLPAIRQAARQHGYAIGLHGSTRRDFDLMAMPWTETCSGREALAHAVAQAACGIDRDGPYNWTLKPCGRLATSIPICWTSHTDEFANMTSVGHIDLSIIEYMSWDQRTAELAEARKRIDQLEKDVAHWKNNHKCEVDRARVLKERTDLPFERVQAYEAFGKLQREVYELQQLLKNK